MLALHLGIAEEDRILNMSIVFFEQIMQEIGYKLNYEAISCYAGNSFFENSWETISNNNPLNIKEKTKEGVDSSSNAMANVLGKGELKIISSPLQAVGMDLETRKLIKDMMDTRNDRTNDTNDTNNTNKASKANKA